MYVDALLADFDLCQQRWKTAIGDRVVSTVFIGGGTPSLMGGAAYQRLFAGLRQRISFADDAEITLEANPGAVDYADGRFAEFRKAGINRLSMGVQTFDDQQLKTLGRIHDTPQVMTAVGLAREAGFDNFNLDLMYALPGQALEQALADVEQAIDLKPTHLSHYQLTLEPNTLFYKQPPPAMPEDELAWDMQLACQQRLAAAGYEQYEVSAYAQAGKRCAHNLNYWTFSDYLAIGAGAHGKITSIDATGELDIQRYWKQKHPTKYLQTAGTADCYGAIDRLPTDDLPFEFAMNALRLNAGCSKAEFEVATGLPFSALLTPLQRHIENDLLVLDRGHLATSATGRQYLNDVLATLLPDT